MATEVEELLLSQIRRDGGTQSRAAINEAVVKVYAEAMKEFQLSTFTPGIVYFDGTDYWLADGFHRLEAGLVNGYERMPFAVRQGTRFDAIEYSVGANARHGLQRTNEDKKRGIRILLSDPHWADKSGRWVAEKCKVSTYLVETVKAEMTSEGSFTPPESNVVDCKTSDGSTKRMDVSAQKSKKGTKRESAADHGFKVVDAPLSAERREAIETEPTSGVFACTNVRHTSAPFAKFNADINAGINTLNALAKSLKEVLGYDPKTKALKNPWAKHFTYESSIQPLLSLVKTLTECSPAEMDGEDFLSAKQVAIRSKKTVAA